MTCAELIPNPSADAASAAAALIIDDDLQGADHFRRVLQPAGFDVMVTNSGQEGIIIARRRRFAAILLDLRLPDLDGLEVLRTLAAENAQSRLVVVGGHLTVKLTVEAIRSGAATVLEKPVEDDQLLTAINTPAFTKPAPATEPTTADWQPVSADVTQNGHSVAHRWANDVVKGCIARRDSKTLAAWAQCAGTSVTMICERCSILDIKPHDARDLMRALFAMLEGELQRCGPHVLLDIADARTLQSFRRKAGPLFQSTRDVEKINQFLQSQKFVEADNYGITVIRTLLSKILGGGPRDVNTRLRRGGRASVENSTAFSGTECLFVAGAVRHNPPWARETNTPRRTAAQRMSE